MKILDINWEGRGYTTKNLIEDLKFVRKTIGEGPIFECPTDTGAIFATAIPTKDDVMKALEWDSEDWDAMEDWLKPENWTKHETFVDYFYKVIEETSRLP
jgi:hypothetical protein